jgi:hypothetical protein
MNVLIFQGPELSDVLAQARAVGSNWTAGRKASPDDLARLNRLVTIAEFLQTKVDDSQSKAFAFNETLKTALQVNANASANAVQKVVRYIREVIANPLTNVSASDYAAALTPSIDTIFEKVELTTAKAKDVEKPEPLLGGAVTTGKPGPFFKPATVAACSKKSDSSAGIASGGRVGAAVDRELGRGDELALEGPDDQEAHGLALSSQQPWRVS